MRVSTIRVPLSKLHPGRDNPRRVKPSAESDQQLLASVRTFGIVQPLVVRPKPGTPGEYQVIAGNRRLKSLRQAHRGDETDPKIRCEVWDVDDATAEAIALAENFNRQPMHALDEAEAFSRLASDDAQGVDAIASAFGVQDRYVRQRMRLANLSKVVKQAFRDGTIDLSIAMEFAALPEDSQLLVWEETGGQPRHADHVRNIVAHAWVDAMHALFDVSTLPEGSLSSDLFSERTLIERSVFMTEQLKALDAEATSLREAGWRDVVTGRYEDIHDRPLSMNVPEREFDEVTMRAMEKLNTRRQRWEEKLHAVSDDDERAMEKIQDKLDALEVEEQEVAQAAPKFFSESTKSIGTAFLMLYPDGQVRREYRVPREPKRGRGTVQQAARSVDSGGGESSAPPSTEALSERQLADLFTHQTLVVREALLKAPAVRKRVLALILHDHVRTDALAIRHDANAVTLHADRGEAFNSAVLERLRAKRQAADPFVKESHVDDVTAIGQLIEMTDGAIAQLIDVLVAECITAHLQRQTALIAKLRDVLDVDLRRTWRPDAPWLSGYQKLQLAELLASLHGRTYNPNVRDDRKKSQLVDELATLFATAADGKIDDKQLANRVNAWLPSVVGDIAGAPRG